MPIAKRRAQPADKKASLKLVARNAQPIDSKYEVIFENASDAILTLNPDFKIDAMNRATEDLLGYVKGELVTHPVELLYPMTTKVQLPSHSRALNSEFFKNAGTYEDVAVLRKDGYLKIVDLSVRHIQNGSESLVMALFRDVTEKKKMERELITKHQELQGAFSQLERKTAEMQAMQETLVQAGKMAALGELTTGIAHELNQPLQAIRGYAQEIQHVLKGRETQVEDSLKEVVSAVDKMAAIIDYLRTYLRKSTEKHEWTDVHTQIEESLKMVGKQFSIRGIQVVKKFDTTLPQVWANPLQIEQVLINLATNARDAIEATKRGSGTIEIQTTRNDKFVEIIFKDDGCGMSERTQAKAFNPFFTTKEVGKGMGLGLSLSYGMIAKLQGSIVLESELGKGTTFRIRIPIDYREI